MSISTDRDFAKAFGEFIRDGRIKKRYSQNELAKRLDLDQSYLSRFEQGSRSVDFELAVKICSCLDLDLNDFLKQLRLSSVSTE